MLTASGRAGEVMLADAAIEPEQVADALAAALRDGGFLVLPHPEVRDYYALRAADTDKWLRGMSRLQQRIEAATADPAPAGEPPASTTPTTPSTPPPSSAPPTPPTPPTSTAKETG